MTICPLPLALAAASGCGVDAADLWLDRRAWYAGRRRQLLALVCLLLAGAISAGSVHADPRQDILKEAVDEYRAALDRRDREARLAGFRRAELLFARLLEVNHGTSGSSAANADLYVNLGNAALGGERIGAAVLAYRRALLLDPDHRRAMQNLRHARTLLPDWVPRPTEGGLFDTFFAWRRRLSREELQLIAAGAFLLFAGTMAASIRWRQSALRQLAIIPAGGWLLMLWLLFIGERSSPDNFAVVTVPEVIARAADSFGAPPRLPQPLPSGTELTVVHVEDQWLRVRLFDNREAWIPHSAATFAR